MSKNLYLGIDVGSVTTKVALVDESGAYVESHMLRTAGKPVIAVQNGMNELVKKIDDYTYLFTNATLDFVTSMVLASTYGMGMMLAAPVLFCWQGSIWLVAKFLSASFFSESLLAELSVVGGIMIFASGLSILNIKNCKTLNILPSLLIPILFFIGKILFNLL